MSQKMEIPQLQRRKSVFLGCGVILVSLLVLLLAPTAQAAATVFVRIDGSDSLCNGTADAPATNVPNCAFATVLKGVQTVDPNGTVNVGPGLYSENLVISQSVTLRGFQAGVDARTRPDDPASESILANGVYVSANSVVIDGFTVQGADGVGDLGPGIYLPGSYDGHQIFNNIIQDNVFGLYLNSSGASQTVVRYNLIRDNNRPGSASGEGVYSDQGLVNAVIDQNVVRGQTTSAIDLSSLTASQSGLTISNNILRGGRGMIILRTTSSTIVNNAITGTNAAYAGIAIYGGVNGLTLTSNTLAGSAGYALTTVNNLGAGNANQNIVLHYNRISGNADGLNIANYSGTLNAENNWWGCNAGPGGANCNSVSGSVDTDPWLKLRITADPGAIFVQGSSTVTADLTYNSNDEDTSATGFIPNGTAAAFSGTLGDISPTEVGTIGGKAQAIFTAGSTPGTATVAVTIDRSFEATISIDPKLDSTTELTAVPASSVYGQLVTFTATVGAIPPETRMPSGMVTFQDSGETIGTAALDASGQAVFSQTTLLQVGSHSITANYSGDGAFNPSNTTVPQPHSVAKADTVLTITADSPDPSPRNQPLSIQYQLSVASPGSGSPSGSVTITDGLTACMGPASGNGSCMLTPSQIGSVTLSASYPGDSNFNASSVDELHQVNVALYLPLIKAD